MDSSDGSVVFGAYDDAVAKHETAFPNTLRGHFSCCGFPSAKSLGFIGQLNPFPIPDVFIVEEVKIESAHGLSTNVACDATPLLKNKQRCETPDSHFQSNVTQSAMAALVRKLTLDVRFRVGRIGPVRDAPDDAEREAGPGRHGVRRLEAC